MKNTTESRTATEIWDWLRTTFATLQFIEVLDDFEVLKTFKLDLSDPTPQIAKYCSHYSCLPMKRTPLVPTPATGAAAPPPPTSESIVSQSMAALILISSLPLNADPAQQSIYQSMVQEYTAAHPVEDMDLDSLSDSIHNTWAACFGNLPDSQKPHKGTFYLKKGEKPAPPKKQHIQVAQKTSAVKDKGPPPSHSSQQQSQSKGKAPASNLSPSAVDRDWHG